MTAKVDIKQQMTDELNKFSALRNQYKKIISMRSQLEVQLNENKIVKEVIELSTIVIELDRDQSHTLIFRS